ncbi:MAG: sulfate ABC transporter permease subunit CysW [Bauldia sp.]|nr:sulfate ABC transporter permease subunit CysW [Bauldia sp.]
MRRRSPARPGARILVGAAVLGALVVFGLPLAVIFTEAFRAGIGAYLAAVSQPNTRHAIWLTVLTALVVVPINIVFGLSAAWLIARFRFPGRRLLLSLVELPLSVAPIVVGTTYLFLYGRLGLFGPFLLGHGIQVMFTVWAIFLVSLFITAPFVVREVLPLMQLQGSEDEEAARSLGANGWQMFGLVTLPNIRWALFYGAVVCNARVMGEFGAVSVVSGMVAGQTNTLPLQIQLLFQDHTTLGAFAAASILTAVALISLIVRFLLETRDRTPAR